MTNGSTLESDTSLSELLFASGITFITGVPDSAFRAFIAELECSEMNRRYVPATREDNAIALAVGASLAGEHPLVFMESSGIGNAIDALTSLASVYSIPLVLFIAWAGYRGRDLPHHNAIGEPLSLLLESLRIPMLEVGLKESLETIASTIQEAKRRANKERQPIAVLGIPKELDDEER
ncbi:MAG TPA: thiamine pyrophosphate-binding protein [Ktedonobacteraceae bacterium]|jgi:phosphonopyruvate decarboxylase|nr:thiamine pyrophosphate-binding protein [Ktedonobacteraceae bacterium]